MLLLANLGGCVTYEFEHEFWLRVDGSGTVNITGRPLLWAAFKGFPEPRKADAPDLEATRSLLERSGLRVRRVTVAHRGGQPYLFVSADFSDLNKISLSPAFPDLDIHLRRDGESLRLQGTWRRACPPTSQDPQMDGLMAVRFHLPSRIFMHANASAGVERGNIVSWRQDITDALVGHRLDFGATMARHSILLSTVSLFAGSILLALGIVGGALYLAFRRGAKHLNP